MASLNKKTKDFVLKDNTLSKKVRDIDADRLEVEVGDAKQPDFKPQLKIKRWENEVNFSLRAQEDPTATVVVEGDKVKYKAKDYEVHLYEKPEAGEDGGSEFEWVLPKKPKSNVLTATIQTKELDFFYQPALTQEEIDQGAERPENVVGSYAVYHKTKKNNRTGGKEYKTGKAFHIYRPEAIDAAGTRSWCELNIDENTGVLMVTVPQAFLDKAKYPVQVDPTFGYTSAGASNSTIAERYSTTIILNSQRRGFPVSGVDGTLDSISAYTATTDESRYVDTAFSLNLKSDGSQIALYQTLGLYHTIAYTLKTITCGGESISAGTYNYLICIVGNPVSLNAVTASRRQKIAYDTGASETTYYKQYSGASAYANSKEDPYTGTTIGGESFLSIYATYTASEGGGGGIAEGNPMMAFL